MPTRYSKRFGLEHCNPVKNPIVPSDKLVKDEGGIKVNSTTYKKMVSNLMYLTSTVPDLMYVVSLTSRFMETPAESHQQAIKMIFRYLKRTTKMGILYNSCNSWMHFVIFSVYKGCIKATFTY